MPGVWWGGGHGPECVGVSRHGLATGSQEPGKLSLYGWPVNRCGGYVVIFCLSQFPARRQTAPVPS